MVGPRTFVPITWLCKKQGAVSHSSSEAEIVSLDAGLRLEGIPSLDLWDQVAEVFKGTVNTSQAPNNKHQQKCHRETIPYSDGKMVDILTYLSNVDFVPPSLPPLKGYGHLIVLEDNEAVIKMTIKQRALALRHTPRVQRVDLDFLFHLFRQDPSICIRYVNTKSQIADILTKGLFTAIQWTALCELIQLQDAKTGLPTQSKGGKTNIKNST